MKIIDLLNRKKMSVSFEVFPPKTNSAFDSVRESAEKIASLHPSYMSVTYGAGGGTSEYTLDIARAIKSRHGVPTLAHLTCVSSSRLAVKEKISAIKAAGIENVMALRGDIPESMINADRSAWDYRYAGELVRELKAANPADLVKRAAQVEAELKEARRSLESAEAKLASAKLTSLISSAEAVGSLRLLTARLDWKPDAVRSICDSLKADCPDMVAVFATVSDGRLNFLSACGSAAVAAGAHAGNILKTISAIAGGKGGGRPDSAMSGGKDLDKIDAALAAVKDLLP
jgi:hypothetical protein